MEQDKTITQNVMPEIRVLPTLGETVHAVGRTLLRLTHFLPEKAPDFMSGHSHVTAPERITEIEDVNRWDDMGTY